jgi:8-oxo-dGTP pyrophosphatase MutT (NUDIX family)
VLLQRRADSGNWALPGGTMNIGETLGQCVVREVKEETGLDIEITGLLGSATTPSSAARSTSDSLATPLDRPFCCAGAHVARTRRGVSSKGCLLILDPSGSQ